MTLSWTKVKQQADTRKSELQQEVKQKTLLQTKLAKEVQAHAATTTKGLWVINSLKAEQENLCPNMAEWRNVLQKDINVMERSFYIFLKVF